MGVRGLVFCPWLRSPRRPPCSRSPRTSAPRLDKRSTSSTAKGRVRPCSTAPPHKSAAQDAAGCTRGRRDRLQRAQSCVARARFRASERGGNDSPPHLVARLAEPSAILPCAGEADDREHRQDGQRQDRLQRVPGAAPRQNGARCHTESLSPPLALPPRLPLPHRLQHLTSRMA